jgi:GT2 family glycosyltransferase
MAVAKKKKIVQQQNENGLQIGAVLVHRGNATDTVACLDSLLTANFDAQQLVVADYFDLPGLDEVIAARHEDCRVLASPENGGFAVAANTGLERLFNEGLDAVLVLAGDLVVADDLKEKMLPSVKHYPDAAAIGPGHYYFGSESPVQHTMEVDPNLGLITRSTGPMANEGGWGAVEVGALAGDAALITKSAYRKVGGFDPEYIEEFTLLEYCLRSRAAGFAVLLVPEARCFMAGLVEKQQIDLDEKAYYRIRNGLKTVSKYGRNYPGASMMRGLNFTVHEVGKTFFKGRLTRKRAVVLAEGIRDFFEGKSGRREADDQLAENNTTG